MKAMVFAAGIGSRLKPFTDEHPKALAPVAGVPALKRVLVKLREARVSRVVVNVHHFADQITDFLAKNGNFGLDLRISDETDRLLDTGGGLLKAAPMLFDGSDEPVLLHNADIITDFPLEEMLAAHRIGGAMATLMTSERKSSRLLYFDDENTLEAWQNVKTGEVRPAGRSLVGLHAAAFGGVHIVGRQIEPLLREYASRLGGGDEIPAFSLVPFYLDVIGKGRSIAYTPSEPFSWFDIGTPEKLRQASEAYKK